MGFVDFSSIHDIWLINSMEQIPQFPPDLLSFYFKIALSQQAFIKYQQS